MKTEFKDLFGATADEMIAADNRGFAAIIRAGKESGCPPLFALGVKYCSQNHHDCGTCSLVNYGRDCHNNPIGV